MSSVGNKKKTSRRRVSLTNISTSGGIDGVGSKPSGIPVPLPKKRSRPGKSKRLTCPKKTPPVSAIVAEGAQLQTPNTNVNGVKMPDAEGEAPINLLEMGLGFGSEFIYDDKLGKLLGEMNNNVEMMKEIGSEDENTLSLVSLLDSDAEELIDDGTKFVTLDVCDNFSVFSVGGVDFKKNHDIPPFAPMIVVSKRLDTQLFIKNKKPNLDNLVMTIPQYCFLSNAADQWTFMEEDYLDPYIKSKDVLVGTDQELPRSTTRSTSMFRSRSKTRSKSRSKATGIKEKGKDSTIIELVVDESLQNLDVDGMEDNHEQDDEDEVLVHEDIPVSQRQRGGKHFRGQGEGSGTDVDDNQRIMLFNPTGQDYVGDFMRFIMPDSFESEILHSAFNYGSRLLNAGLVLATSVIGDESDLEPREDVLTYNGYKLRVSGRGLLLQGIYFNCNTHTRYPNDPQSQEGPEEEAQFRMRIQVQLTPSGVPSMGEHGYSEDMDVRVEVDEDKWILHYVPSTMPNNNNNDYYNQDDSIVKDSFITIQVPDGLSPFHIRYFHLENGMLVIKAP